MSDAPKTSEKSWIDLVTEADPEYWEKKATEPAYQFSNGREFVKKP